MFWDRQEKTCCLFCRLSQGRPASGACPAPPATGWCATLSAPPLHRPFFSHTRFSPTTRLPPALSTQEKLHPWTGSKVPIPPTCCSPLQASDRPRANPARSPRSFFFLNEERPQTTYFGRNVIGVEYCGFEVIVYELPDPGAGAYQSCSPRLFRSGSLPGRR